MDASYFVFYPDICFLCHDLLHPCNSAGKKFIVNDTVC